MKRKVRIKRVNITLNYRYFQLLSDLAFSNYMTPTTMAKLILVRNIDNEYKNKDRKENFIPGTQQTNLFKRERK